MEKNEQKNPRTKGFRLSSRRLLVTYLFVAGDKEHTKETVCSFFQAKGFDGILIAEEYAPTTGTRHFHCLVTTSKKFETRNERVFDLPDRPDGSKIHPNIETVKGTNKDFNRVYDYLHKSDPSPLALNIDRFSSSSNFTNEYRDYINYTTYTLSKSRTSPFPFLLPDGTEVQQPTLANKRCSWWIWGPPDSGKSYWLGTTFAGKRVYQRCSNSNYPFDGYTGEPVIVWDDAHPKLDELLQTSNPAWAEFTPVYGPTRYIQRFKPVGCRPVLIVLSNLHPDAYFKFNDNDEKGET